MKVLIIFICIAALLCIPLCVFRLEVQNNLFDWDPDFDLFSFALIAGALTCSALVFILTKRLISKFYFPLIVIYLIGSFLFIFYIVLAEQPLEGGFMGRSQNSPMWFNALCAFLLLLPSVSLFKTGKKNYRVN